MAARALFLALLLACCPVASAMTLDDLSPGKTVHGPNLSLKEMKGKVVFVLYWGTH
jgi:hypothetical protein